jgi:transcriptional regulator GlxA family with amidase domain
MTGPAVQQQEIAMSFLAPHPALKAQSDEDKGRAIAVDVFLPEDAAPAAAHQVQEFFAAANELITGPKYHVSLLRLSLPLPDDPQFWKRRTVIFLGSHLNRWQADMPTSRRLLQIGRQAARVLFVGGAVFLARQLARKSGQPLAVHPNFSAAAQEEELAASPVHAVLANTTTINSAISGFALPPVLMQFVAQDHGAFLADAIGNYLGLGAVQPRQDQGSPSKVALQLRQRACGDGLISAIIDLMQENIEEPLQIREIARQLGVSGRKLERRFHEKTATKPLAAYRMLRIERAHQLLLHTDLPLAEIVEATGFGSRSNLRHWLREEVGVSPQALRQRSFRGAAGSGAAEPGGPAANDMPASAVRCAAG